MSKSGDPGRLGSVPANTASVSLRAVIDARRRLDELGTAKLVGEAVEVVHKAQQQGQPLAALSPDAIVVRAGEIVLELPPSAVTGYSSPERVRGSSGDRRSDVFSLGVILWEALAHVRLFDGATEDAVKAAVLGGVIQPVSELNANVPAELDAICKKALARDPADRYQSAKVMAAEISAVLDDAGYPDSTDEVMRWIATEFPNGAAPRAGTQPPANRPPLGSQTVLGMAPMRIDESAHAEPKPPAVAPPPAPVPVPTPVAAVARPSSTTPPVSALPSWASKPAATSPPPNMTLAGTQPPGSLASHPGMRLPAGPPGASIAVTPAAPILPPIVATPTAPPAMATPGPATPSFAATSILGSPNSPPAPAPVPFSGTRTAILGSNSIIEASNAAVAAANPPVAAPASPSKHDLPIPFAGRPAIKASVSQAETIATPVTQTPLPPKLPTTVPFAPAIVIAESPPAPVIAAGNLPPAADDFAETSTHTPATAADVVSLPRRDRTGKGDVLDGWGRGTDAHEAIGEDDVYEDDKRTGKKRLLIALGGAMALILVITVVAFAFSGSKKKADVTAKKPASSEPFGALPPAKTEPVAEPPKTEPAPVTEPPKTEPVTEPPKPAITEPIVTEAPKPELPKPEPVKVAKTEPPKPDPVKVAKPDPVKLTKTEPKKPDRRDLVAKKPDKKPRDPGIPKPVDPYAPQPLKLDAAASYKAGLQQFARGDANGALTTFKASLATDPGFAPTWRGIGLVYEKLGKKSQAKTAFKRYLQLSPNAGDAEQIRDRLEKLGT